PTLLTEIVPGSQPVAPEGATSVQISRQMRMQDGDFMIEFMSLANRTYYVQYSSDMQTWKTSLPSVRGSGTYAQWMDDGAPRTESRPAGTLCRFYRVLLAP